MSTNNQMTRLHTINNFNNKQASLSECLPSLFSSSFLLETFYDTFNKNKIAANIIKRGLQAKTCFRSLKVGACAQIASATLTTMALLELMTS
jgi:hypothetical protein